MSELIWITRTQPQAEATAARVRERGFETLVDPLLAVENLTPAIDAARYDHIIATSINGLSSFTTQHVSRHQSVWAVGDATADAARQAGFTRVHSAAGDAKDLIALLRAIGPEGPILYLRPEIPAQDLMRALSSLDITPAIYYRTVGRDAPEARVRLNDITHVLLHSPRAAEACAPYLTASEATVICISEATAQRLREHLNFTGNLPSAGLNIEVAASPDEEALLARL
ncbi:uroporphyrinogen-III synthase [Asticcacaulis sp. AND118]|uniref:uroporphyrinogen-III synthase n=1 Tax=Asticcacaulis sp. AND118 TaxID=2840468 RepID=UPI001D001138|nr:uroporphyrinogen-III synthase [Asticcacaulis sp. AND118]UDF04150.1 uroporphyrinogen-III synthase [Asticcacaulis sp. AND118]